jgi:hypothetical protein
MKRHDSDSTEQGSAETIVLEALRKQLSVQLQDPLPIDLSAKLDGFEDGKVPICVEIWAHQGKAKGGQIKKNHD